MSNMAPGLYLSSEQTNSSSSPTEADFYNSDFFFMNVEAAWKDDTEETLDVEESVGDLGEFSPRDEDTMSDTMPRRKMKRFR
jgi:hypothetical protein